MTEPDTSTSDFAAVKDAGFLTGVGLATDFYDNVDAGSVGSPLGGGYVAEIAAVDAPMQVPAIPLAGLAVLALGIAGIQARRA